MDFPPWVSPDYVLGKKTESERPGYE